mmetsp:Transcript_151796/g.368635  ORF Transcript_151796/g.368635 Transcript_151796/m.368635 type:complete len:228 (-) Transcript_151796:901-1584(-)
MASLPLCSWVVLKSRLPTLYIRNLRPSSVDLSNTGGEDFKMWSNMPACARYSGRGCKPLPCVAVSWLLPLRISQVGFQEYGKRGPGSLATNWLLKKCSFRSWRVFSSFSTMLRSFSTYAELGSGGMNCSPSSRRSERQGLKISLKNLRSSAVKIESEPPSRLAQNALEIPAPVSSPLAACDPVRTACSKSNLSRLRSTPCRLGTSRRALRPSSVGWETSMPCICRAS